VVHLAGIAHANRANVEPHLAFEHTVRTLACTLEAVRGRRPHFIYFSSSMVYGNFASGTVDEDSPCTPLGVYGSLKYGGEKMVIAAGQVSGMPWTIIRPSALYGERCVSRRVVQVFIESALDGRELVVAGDGEDRLDFTYIEDLVHGVVCAIESPAAHDQVFNLTCGCSRSIRELIDLVTEEFDGVTVRFEPRDRLTPSRGTLCVDKARSLIGYAPSATLERGFGQYARWYRSFARRPAGRANAPELLVGS
ncbi:MAG: NAD(P)-dependent oxidoreductase, partial [Phycisphaerales bacterium]|nr:NAD(P)-dependent oxidoreductase [Phycisphaerales bacterium]